MILNAMKILSPFLVMTQGEVLFCYRKKNYILLNVIVFNYQKKSDGNNLIYQQLNKDEDMLTQILSSLYQQQIQSLIVEGGTKLLQSFINAGLWDEARVITNTEMIIGNGVASPVLNNEVLLNEVKRANDIVSFFKKGAAKIKNRK